MAMQGRPVFITRLLLVSKVRVFLRTFYTLRYTDRVNGGYTFEKYPFSLTT